MADRTIDPNIRGDAPSSVSNEFAHVQVRKVFTRNGERLEISAPRLGYRIRLDALELESLTWQTTATFSRFLEEPFGPHESDADEGGSTDGRLA